jgi:hypothetical protein
VIGEYVDADRTIFVTDRHHGGLYGLRHTARA